MRALMLVLVAVAACDHSTPFTASSYGTDQPLKPGSPRQLTYSAGRDGSPAWLPDESAIIYSRERTDRPDHDRCLAVLPRDGGQITNEICDVAAAAANSTDVLSAPAADALGRVAYSIASSRVGATVPLSVALVLSGLADQRTTQTLAAFPYFAAAGDRHDGAEQVHWLGTGALVYLAVRTGIEQACRFCPIDSIATGVAIDRLDLSPAAHVSLIGGTAYASSVAAGPTSDVIYFTMGGDSRVFRRALATGAQSTVFDFGSGIARDAQVVGSRLVAVVGGTVTFGYDSLLGYPVQHDSGGPLHVVDLTTGKDSILLIPPLTFRRPALSPSGKRLVVEAWSGRTSDLWEFVLP